ncbi:MAG: flagellar biosynthetic protein FliO [Planctomycetota bacterium]
MGTRTTTGAFFTLVLSALLGSTASPLSAQQPIRSRYALSVDKSPADSTAPGRTNAETQLLVSSGSAEAEAVTPNQVNSDDSFPAFTLGSRGRVGDQDANAPADTTSKWTGTAITMGTSLTLVLGLFACFVLVMRRFGGAGQGKGELPKEVFSQLGGTAIDPRTRITMIRCGSRILVVSQTAQSTSTLCEITDMDEVQAITAACTGASQEEFMKTLKTLESTPSQPGFTDAPARQRSSPRRLFATA